MFTPSTLGNGSNQGGFSLVEVLVTIVVLSIGMLGSAGMQTAALQANTQTRYQVVAVALASELAEAMRGNHRVALSTDPADNPVNNDWSGRVRKLALTLSTDGQSAAVASSPLWDAAEVLTARTQVDHGADRNIVVGSPLGLQGTTGPSPFRWTSALANVCRHRPGHGIHGRHGHADR